MYYVFVLLLLSNFIFRSGREPTKRSTKRHDGLGGGKTSQEPLPLPNPRQNRLTTRQTVKNNIFAKKTLPKKQHRPASENNISVIVLDDTP